MKILVDTTVWSLALRRSHKAPLSLPEKIIVNALADLMRDGRALMLGAVRQELLSGVKLQAQFENLQKKLTAYSDFEVTTLDFEAAALAHNTCRANGVQGSSTDFLLCALSLRHQLPIFSVDRDFPQYQKWLPLQLYTPQS